MPKEFLKRLVFDGSSAFISLYAAFLLRFEFNIPDNFFQIMLYWMPWFIFPQIIVSNLFGLHIRVWRFTSLFDLYAIIKMSCSSLVITMISLYFMDTLPIYPRSVIFLYFIFNNFILIAIRLGIRVYYSHYHEDSKLKNPLPIKKLILIGAGKTGEKIAKEILTSSRNQYKLVGFVDDNIDKKGSLIHGKEVFGPVNSLLNTSIQYDELVITSPSASREQIRKIIRICEKIGKRYKTVPGISELINGEVSLDRVRDVSYSDLLGREEIALEMNSIKGLLRGKRVLITGAGGSIGSELIRQCITFQPAEIICLDHNEEKIYNLDEYSKKNQSKTIFKNILSSVNNKIELEKVFLDNQPQIVFHAAAYKHVPIQEVFPWTAVNTNIGGTLNLVELSDKYMVDKFVLVSTDKAVNPANVMGATKRAAEKLIQSFNFQSKTKFMAVRFGNVLGSSGSAIPTFQNQINDGGPITITHPDMTRYFMSIQEASQLIIQCGAFGSDGEIFLLEMGEPISILQMAKDLIRLSGLEPEIDIPIVYTGLRPGEKLYEELQLSNEQIVTTDHKKIMILKEKQIPTPWRIFKQSSSEVLKAARNLDKDAIQSSLKQMLPTYLPRIFDSSVETRKKDFGYEIKGQA